MDRDRCEPKPRLTTDTGLHPSTVDGAGILACNNEQPHCRSLVTKSHDPCPIHGKTTIDYTRHQASHFRSSRFE